MKFDEQPHRLNCDRNTSIQFRFRPTTILDMSGAYPAGDDAASIATEATEAMPAPVDPRVRARLAAEARSRLPPSNPSSTAADAFSMQTFVASAQDKLPFHRLLDTQVSQLDPMSYAHVSFSPRRALIC